MEVSYIVMERVGENSVTCDGYKMKPTKKQEKRLGSRPRRLGKSTFVKDSFLAQCEAGESVEYQHPKYVCMSRKRYKELATQKKEIRNIVSGHIGSCDHPCERCETAREILKQIK